MLFLLLSLQQAAAPADSGAFADERTEALVRGAIERQHGAEDGTVSDYEAKFRYRLSFGLGRRRWALVPNASVEEQEGTVQWTAPNDLRVEILGDRTAARSEALRMNSRFDRPWFIPRSLSDSIRVFGNDIPPRAALHPLAEEGPAWYRYRLLDSVQVGTPDGRRVRLLAVAVTPRRLGPSLVAGKLWLDADHLDLVRFSFRFVGQELWLDPDDQDSDDVVTPERINRLVSRILTLDADLEYALQEHRFWMPYRQVVSGRVELPWFGELVIPFEATTTFDDYQINAGRPIVFQVPLPPDSTSPDSLRTQREQWDSLQAERRARRRGEGGPPEEDLARDDVGRWDRGRFEIHRAPRDSLRTYAAWGDSLVLDDDPLADREVRQVQSELELMTADLPGELTGKRTSGLSWGRIPSLFRYNRIQGLAPGLEYQFPLPGDRFTTARLEGRFGLSDSRVTGAVTLVREAPGARWTLAGYRDIRSNDPFARANAFGNTLNSLFAGHDDADYHEALGVRLLRESALGLGLELRATVLVERERSVRREAKSWLNDALGGTGLFPANPAISDGTFGGAAVQLEHGFVTSRWLLGADLLSNGDRTTARLYGQVRRALGRGASPTLVFRSGIATATPLSQQVFRIGGTGTVRGFNYGTRGGQAFWAAQMDWPLRRGLVQPVVFADAGQAAPARDLFRSKALAGGGAGLALLGGLLRFDLSYPFTSGGSGLRFDLRVQSLF
jgi:hypothetical protein